MLINSLLQQLPETVTPVLIANPYVSSEELLLYLANTLGIETTGAERVLELTDAVKSALLEAKSRDRHLILIIDEAHLLSDQALEEIRLLSNTETPDQKLLQILLVGQYELSHNLDRPEMRHLRQRININRFLSHLNRTDTIAYIDHRLQRVGSSYVSVFEENCGRLIFRLTKGVPRNINRLCDNALLICMAKGRRQATRRTLRQAQAALQADRLATPKGWRAKARGLVWKYCKFYIF
jgi:type II secretory pathway predicted ATPase ExeA